MSRSATDHQSGVGIGRSPWLWGSIAVWCAIAAVSAGLYAFLPERMPIHWNMEGQADGYASRVWGATLMPAISAVLLLLLAFLPRWFADDFRDRTARVILDQVTFLMMLFLGALHLITLRAALQPELEAGRWIITLVMILFVALGMLMPRMPRNRWMGVRTPWTLADDRVWRDTHRCAGGLFVVSGSLGAGASLFGAPLWIPLVLLLPAVVIPVVYSYVRYRQVQRS